LKNIGQGGTNTSGFSAFVAGFSDGSGNFGDLGSYGNFWSSTNYNEQKARYMWVWKYAGTISLSQYDKVSGFSVRCLKD
ncbi:MAG: hypothetical protein HXY50_10540, partial [Ignavibacteriaceae bacterium]|nr:hypothetical protein [Ignavibacteriaceae bacterium]